MNVKRKVFILYSTKDKNEIWTYWRNYLSGNATLTEHRSDEINDNIKNKILECDIFIFCLSKNAPEARINIVKFARSIARKEVNVVYLDAQQQTYENKKVEDLSFLKDKTKPYQIDEIEKLIENVKNVNI